MAWSSDPSCRLSCVKLYLCSNPLDSVVERSALRERVFPKLKEHCRQTLGLDFSVIDPFESSDAGRWPDEGSRQQLIKECRENSAGPFLLALVGHQYGTASLPIQVDVGEFQLLLHESQQAGISTRELEAVYQRDENTIPPSYCLRPPHRSPCCPPLSETSEEEHSKFKAKEEEVMKVFQTSVSLCVYNGLMTTERAHRYYRSALDTDLRFALGNRPDSDIIRRCLVYVHEVVDGERERGKGQKDLQLQSESEAVTSSDPRTKLTDGHLLSDLCDNFLPGLITSQQLLVYTTTTACDRRYGYTSARRRAYAESLCQQAHSDLLGLIDILNTVETRNGRRLADALSREQAEQEELCDALSRLYDVAHPEEQKIRAYVKQTSQQCPLVVIGGPCTGKTVLLAHCARQMASWLPDSDPVVVTYFCDLQPLVSPLHLLRSLCYQVATRYYTSSSGCPSSTLDSNQEVINPHVSDCYLNCTTKQYPHAGILKPDISASEMKEHLSTLLSLLPSPQHPLILNLDGLDQFENNFIFPQIIESLPSPLPPAVKLILTVSSTHTSVLQAIELHYPSHCVSEGREGGSGCVCVQLGLASRKECVKLLASSLRSSGRRVTSGQQALVNRAMTSCCLTLYARLLHVHASLWCSDSDVTESSLPIGIHASISALLDHLEQKHGSSLVAHVMSYLTLSRTGVTEVELADLLSVNDSVLSEYVQQEESCYSSMRVPQVDVERLLLDLKLFLIRKTFVGLHVLLWASRHFKLVVTERYLGSKEAKREIHSEMADYFSGRWACGNGKSLFVNQNSRTNGGAAQKKTHLCIDRQSSCQPFVFSCSSKDVSQVNLKKLVDLPYHLQQSGRWEELEHRLFMSFEFHQAMVQAGLLGDLLTMLERNEPQFRFLRERLLLAGVLRSSSCLLQQMPLRLPTLMETGLLPYLEAFPALTEYLAKIRRERKSRGSGLGLVVCPAPASVPYIHFFKCGVKAKDVSVAGAAGVVVVVTGDGSAWVWRGSGCDAAKVLPGSEWRNLKFSGVKASGRFVLLSTECNKLLLWDVSGPERLLLVQDPPTAETEIAGVVACWERVFMWWEDESFVGVFHVSSGTVTRFQCQSCVTCLVCTSNGSYVYCGQEDGTISIFQTDSGQLLGSSTNTHRVAVTAIIVCEDKREMACVDRTGNVTLWGVASETQPHRLKERLAEGGSSQILSHDHSEENGTLLVCQSSQVTLWDTCDWEMWDQFLAPRGKAFTQAVLSQCGHLFLALLDDCALVLVWRVRTGECVLSLDTSQQPHALLKAASDVVCVARDGSVTVWDSEMIAAAGAAPKPGRGVTELAVEQAGEWFYTTDGSQAVWRWGINGGLPCATFLHGGPVEKLCLSPDDRHLVTLSAGDIYTWWAETGENVLRIGGSGATDVLITPNNNFGVSVSKRGVSRVWRLAHGGIVCSIHLYLSSPKVSPESTFLIGCHSGDLLAASLWSGAISKCFSCVERSERVAAFQTLSEHPDFVLVMATSGAVYTWKIAEESVCRHFQLPYTLQRQPQDMQMSSDGRFTLLAIDHNTVRLFDLSQVRLCSLKAEGPVIKACMDQTGRLVAYISLEKICACERQERPVLTVVRLTDLERLGCVHLSKNPLTVVVSEHQCVYVGFEDGCVGVYDVSDGIRCNGENSFRCRENVTDGLKPCPFDRAPLCWLPLATPSIIWP